MSVPTLRASHTNGDNWVLHLVPVSNHGLVASLSNGVINIYPLDGNPDRNFAPIRSFKAHNGSISSLKKIDDDHIATAGDDGIKIFDLRQKDVKPLHTFHNIRNLPFLSMDVKNDLIAGGTELKGADAELLIWNLKTKDLVRAFVDSHHDDITDIKFHPTNDKFLLSGSTDGYVNVYNLEIDEEDDALHQVINYASIHSTGWLSPNRIYTLSHMETFAIHELNDTSDDLTEPKPLDFGDVRESWNCEYVVDIYPGFIATGTNSRSSAKLYPFRNETIDLKKSIDLNGAHGEEVIRSLYIPSNCNLLYTGGEDGCLKVWKSEIDLNAPKSFFSDEDEPMANDEESVEKEGKKKEKKEKKQKREKKDKKEKKEKKKNKEHRFKPY